MKTMLERGAGILMPVSSLPSPYGIGTFGSAAYEFVDFLKKARQKLSGELTILLDSLVVFKDFLRDHNEVELEGGRYRRNQQQPCA